MNSYSEFILYSENYYRNYHKNRKTNKEEQPQKCKQTSTEDMRSFESEFETDSLYYPRVIEAETCTEIGTAES